MIADTEEGSRFFADLHIHSHFSRATSKALAPGPMAAEAKIKGLDLLGTGDLTHPGWLDELSAALEMGQDGFYHLKGQGVSGTAFVPTGEVSAIYKQGGRTRKIHLVFLAPDLEAARRFSQSLGQRGNVTSDGRPILGLSARDLLEIGLTASAEMLMFPAHIWTPWFSLFGSMSGFDVLEDCFLDLSSHVAALETGLSSDPEMCRLVSALDSRSLVSSSDAHSLEKLGREATIVRGERNRDNLWKALSGGSELLGTVEFFPEEGKYHLDGHSACGPALNPRETKELKGICPVCGKPLTIGVLNRVMELADRENPPPDLLKPDYHIIPVDELLADVLGKGAGSKAVKEGVRQIVSAFGSQYSFLLSAPLEMVRKEGGEILALALSRMRDGLAEKEGGYDGKFGKISLIQPEDRAAMGGLAPLLGLAISPKKRSFPTAVDQMANKSAKAQQSEANREIKGQGLPEGHLDGHPEDPQEGPRPAEQEQPVPSLTIRRRSAPREENTAKSFQLLWDSLDQAQMKAVSHPGKTLVILAGPGSGKTMVLLMRAIWLMKEGLASPERLLITSYTRKAVESLKERLELLAKSCLGGVSDSHRLAWPKISTLHSLAYDLALKARPGWTLASPEYMEAMIKEVARRYGLQAGRLRTAVSSFKNSALAHKGWEREAELGRAIQDYQMVLDSRRYFDFDDLISQALIGCGTEERWAGPAYEAVLADEAQDFTASQGQLLLALARGGKLTLIGDPDQSIYGFRGAKPDSMLSLGERRCQGENFSNSPDCGPEGELQTAPEAKALCPPASGSRNFCLSLSCNYRSTHVIAEASEPFRTFSHLDTEPRCAMRLVKAPRIIRAHLQSPWDEAAFVTRKIKESLGPMALGLTGQAKGAMPDLAFSDIAVLFRLRLQAQTLSEALEAHGLPYQVCGEEEITAADQLDFKADKISLLTRVYKLSRQEVKLLNNIHYLSINKVGKLIKLVKAHIIKVLF